MAHYIEMVGRLLPLKYWGSFLPRPTLYAGTLTLASPGLLFYAKVHVQCSYLLEIHQHGFSIVCQQSYLDTCAATGFLEQCPSVLIEQVYSFKCITPASLFLKV